MNGMPLLIFFIYSGITINLLLQCGLGIKGTVESRDIHVISLLTKSFIIFFTIIVLWLILTKLLYNLIPGNFIYLLVFPVSSIIYDGFEYLLFRYVLKKDSKTSCFIDFPQGICSVALFLCIILAGSFLEVIVLSFGFTFGIIAVNLIVREIRYRATLETVPVFLRGKPFVLITLGMLSLIFTSASWLLFTMIGVR